MNCLPENIKDLKIGVIGLGYVGLPLAVEFGKIRSVLGYDIRKERDELDKKLPPIGERTREQITDWLTNSSLTYDDIVGVGW